MVAQVSLRVINGPYFFPIPPKPFPPQKIPTKTVTLKSPKMKINIKKIKTEHRENQDYTLHLKPNHNPD